MSTEGIGRGDQDAEGDEDAGGRDVEGAGGGGRGYVEGAEGGEDVRATIVQRDRRYRRQHRRRRRQWEMRGSETSRPQKVRSTMKPQRHGDEGEGRGAEASVKEGGGNNDGTTGTTDQRPPQHTRRHTRTTRGGGGGGSSGDDTPPLPFYVVLN